MVRELILSRCEKREVIQWVQFERSASSRREHIENLLIGHELAGLQLSADIATSVKYSISYLGYFRQKNAAGQTWHGLGSFYWKQKRACVRGYR